MIAAPSGKWCVFVRCVHDMVQGKGTQSIALSLRMPRQAHGFAGVAFGSWQGGKVPIIHFPTKLS